MDHECNFGGRGRKVAEVSKKRLRARDTYTVDIEPGEDDIVVLASTIALDAMTY